MAKTEQSPSSHSAGHIAPPPATTAVLVSGGLDSAILVGELVKRGGSVQPLCVRSGLLWETDELRHLQAFLEAVSSPALRQLVILELPVFDIYGKHWSVTGRAVPDADTPDDAVYLPGRNVLLLAKSMLWCHLHDVTQLALGILEANPFPDATPTFLAAFQHAVNRAVDGKVQISRPYAGLSKVEVMQRGRGLPLELTFSCIRPIGGRHCGECNKCAERRRAFGAAGLPDATNYAKRNPCSA